MSEMYQKKLAKYRSKTRPGCLTIAKENCSVWRRIETSVDERSPISSTWPLFVDALKRWGWPVKEWEDWKQAGGWK